MIGSERYLRQMRLADVGEEGQARLGAASANVHLSGTAAKVAVRYLAGAGFGTIRAVDSGANDLRDEARRVNGATRLVPLAAPASPVADVEHLDSNLAALDPAARELAEGARAALAEIRRVLLVEAAGS